MRRIRQHLTYANVISTLALFVALGGTTYAATGGNFILGQSNSASTPTSLSSGASQALKVTNTTAHAGVWASGGSVANNAAAVHGQSTAGNGVEGISGKNTASGVYGQNNSTGFGVAGRSTNGTAVLGDSSSGWAFNASGNATQTRAGGGFVKAMAYVNPAQTNDPIQQCFNSQLPPSQATRNDCGLSYSSSGIGFYYIGFGFNVRDRFLSATTDCNICSFSAYPASIDDNTVAVSEKTTGDASGADGGFYLFVY